MTVEELDFDKRNNTSLDLALGITLPGQDGKTINISASGVYFEVITNDVDTFAIDTAIPVKIAAITARLDLRRGRSSLAVTDALSGVT